MACPPSRAALQSTDGPWLAKQLAQSQNLTVQLLLPPPQYRKTVTQLKGRSIFPTQTGNRQ